APVTREQCEYQTMERGGYIIGDPQEVAEKIIRHSEALGGIDRLTFQMDTGNLPHEKLMKSIELIGSQVIPLVDRMS
ncbi:MAG: LLM class flavin-dependent oxidoreductase, partial [Cyclobacteriaceae bacterium]